MDRRFTEARLSVKNFNCVDSNNTAVCDPCAAVCAVVFDNYMFEIIVLGLICIMRCDVVSEPRACATINHITINFVKEKKKKKLF